MKPLVIFASGFFVGLLNKWHKKSCPFEQLLIYDFLGEPYATESTGLTTSLGFSPNIFSWRA